MAYDYKFERNEIQKSMADRIIPKILNGSKQLIVAETVSFFPQEGLKVIIPAVNQLKGRKTLNDSSDIFISSATLDSLRYSSAIA